MRVSSDDGFPSFTVDLTDVPIKHASIDRMGGFLMVIAHDDAELAIVDLRDAFKIKTHIIFNKYDTKFDDLMHHPIKFASIITDSVILLMNEKGLFRLVDFSIEKPSPWQVCQLQKYFKVDFRLGHGTGGFLPVTKGMTLKPIVKVKLEFGMGRIEGIIMVA